MYITMDNSPERRREDDVDVSRDWGESPDIFDDSERSQEDEEETDCNLDPELRRRVQRSINAFVNFTNHMRPFYKSLYPHDSLMGLTGRIGQQWAGLSNEEKHGYCDVTRDTNMVCASKTSPGYGHGKMEDTDRAPDINGSSAQPHLYGTMTGSPIGESKHDAVPMDGMVNTWSPSYSSSSGSGLSAKYSGHAHLNGSHYVSDSGMCSKYDRGLSHRSVPEEYSGGISPTPVFNASRGTTSLANGHDSGISNRNEICIPIQQMCTTPSANVECRNVDITNGNTSPKFTNSRHMITPGVTTPEVACRDSSVSNSIPIAYNPTKFSLTSAAPNTCENTSHMGAMPPRTRHSMLASRTQPRLDMNGNSITTGTIDNVEKGLNTSRSKTKIKTSLKLQSDYMMKYRAILPKPETSTVVTNCSSNLQLSNENLNVESSNLLQDASQQRYQVSYRCQDDSAVFLTASHSAAPALIFSQSATTVSDQSLTNHVTDSQYIPCDTWVLSSNDKPRERENSQRYGVFEKNYLPFPRTEQSFKIERNTQATNRATCRTLQLSPSGTLMVESEDYSCGRTSTPVKLPEGSTETLLEMLSPPLVSTFALVQNDVEQSSKSTSVEPNTLKGSCQTEESPESVWRNSSGSSDNLPLEGCDSPAWFSSGSSTGKATSLCGTDGTDVMDITQNSPYTDEEFRSPTKRDPLGNRPSADDSDSDSAKLYSFLYNGDSHTLHPFKSDDVIIMQEFYK